MRAITALALIGTTFVTMGMAAHAQFNGVPGVEHAQAQVVDPGTFQNFKPLDDNWRDAPTQPLAPAPVQSEYVQSEADVQAIIGNVAQAQNVSPAAAQAAQPVQSVNLAAPAIGDSDCSRAIAASETKYGIPPHMLRAIALTESGREGEPYPWAMNIMGRAHYASGPDEMVQIVNNYGSRASIDIGCTQINLKYHGHRFADWRSLLDPQTNADYAAYHLLELRREFGSWSKAVSAYHSRTSWRGANYACTVSRNYGKIFGDNRKGCGPDIEMLAAYLVQNRI